MPDTKQPWIEPQITVLPDGFGHISTAQIATKPQVPQPGDPAIKFCFAPDGDMQFRDLVTLCVGGQIIIGEGVTEETLNCIKGPEYLVALALYDAGLLQARIAAPGDNECDPVARSARS